MSHQDRTSCIVVNHKAIKQVADCLLPSGLFAGIKPRSDATWKPRMLAMAALVWGAAGERTLKGRFELGRKIVKKVFRWQPSPGATYQGFIKMLRRWHAKLMIAIVPHVRVQTKEMLPGQWMIAGYVVFAGDGSRIELARTESLEDAFSPKRKKNKKKQKRRSGKGRCGRGRKATKRKATKKQSLESVKKKANSPQMWLTLFWHVGCGLPWAWRTGPSDSSERAHLEEMLTELPEKSLITADAGFVGYDFWNSILNAKHNFLIRVGANVRLLRKLGCAREYDHVVYLWPDAAAKKKQRPLVLRLIVLHEGRHPVYLVTNLTKSQLSDQQAATIYGARWGIELFFRTFKQTFGRRKLLSDSAANATLELDWSLLGLWCICLMAQRELADSGTDPAWLSPASAIDAFQSTLVHYRSRPESLEEDFWQKLRMSVRDGYKRTSSKTSRNFPRKKQRVRVGAPKITKANKQQIQTAKEIKHEHEQLRLPA